MKKVFCLLLSAIMLLSMAACGSKADSPQVPSPSQDPSPAPAAPTPGPSDGPKEPSAPARPQLIRLQRSPRYDYVTEPINDYWFTLATCRWDLLSLTEEGCALYPGLDAYLQNSNAYHSANADEQMHRYADLAREMVSGGNTFEGFSGFPFETTTHVTRSDETAVSYVVSYYTYAGGVHPDMWVETYNVDPNTGLELALSDFVNDEEQLKDVLAAQLKEGYEEVFENQTEADIRSMLDDIFSPSDDFDLNGEPTGTKSSDLRWSVGYQGLTFYFNTYQLSYYAAGDQTVVLMADQVPGLLKTDKLTPPEEYVTPLFGWQNFYDLDGDGTAEPVSINTTGEYDEYMEEYFQTALTVETPRGSYTLDGIEVSDTACYMIHLADDSEILLAALEGFWAGQVALFDLGGRPAYLETLGGYLSDGLVTDPSSVFLGLDTQIAGTFYGVRPYRFGEYGSFEAQQPFYELYSELEMVSTEALELPVVDDPLKTSFARTRKFAAGTHFTVVRSDNNEYLDLKDTGSGTVVRLQVTFGEYQSDQYIYDGRPIEDVFECIYWAG